MREPKYNFQGAFATALLRGGGKPLTTKGTKVHDIEPAADTRVPQQHRTPLALGRLFSCITRDVGTVIVAIRLTIVYFGAL
jgi:hypothetical protein